MPGIQNEEATQVAEANLRERLQEVIPEVDREAVSSVLDLVVRSKAPASTSPSKHGCFEGGLLCHISMVYSVGVGLTHAGHIVLSELLSGRSAEQFRFSREDLSRELLSVTSASMFKVALLHDLNKVARVTGHPYYVPNILKGGNRSDKKPWEINESGDPLQFIEDALRVAAVQNETAASALQRIGPLFQFSGVSIREGLVSLAVANSIAPQLVNGLTREEKLAIVYHDGAYAGKVGMEESVLQLLLHCADMIASRFLC